MSMTFSELANRAHKNAIEKGWYDKNPDGSIIQRDVAEVCSLFHSEISEAVEEFRKPQGVKGIYFKYPNCAIADDDPAMFPNAPPVYSTVEPFEGNKVTSERYAKPEGVAVELADLLIRLGDSAAAWGIADLVDSCCNSKNIVELYLTKTSPIGELAFLHSRVSGLLSRLHIRQACLKIPIRDIVIATDIAYIYDGTRVFCVEHGFDLDRALELKMVYNTTRSWRHGGKTA